MKKVLINNQINCLINVPDNMNQIVIYCHGFGENKQRIEQHAEVLAAYNIGMIGFDFPCHGEDITEYQSVTYDLCIDYLDKVIYYLEDTYPNIPISIIGSSFGGYIVLSYINDKKYKFKHVYLKYPAVNFYECLKRKLNITDEYFDTHDYYELPSGYKLYKQFYLDCKSHDVINNFDKGKNKIYVIQGSEDKTVLVEDVKNFVINNKLKINIVVGSEHGLKNYLGLINNELIQILND